MIYDFPMSLILKLEKKVSFKIGKWLGLHRSIFNVCLYSISSPCLLSLQRFSSVLKSAKASVQRLLRESKDPFVSNTNSKMKAGRCDALDNISEAEALIEFKKVLGYTHTNRAGLRCRGKEGSSTKGFLSIPKIDIIHCRGK